MVVDANVVQNKEDMCGMYETILTRLFHTPSCFSKHCGVFEFTLLSLLYLITGARLSWQGKERGQSC